MFTRKVKKYVMPAFAMMFVASASYAASEDTAEYTEKRRLHCTLLEQNIMFEDSPKIGSRSVGWLRRIDKGFQEFASVEVDGWYVRSFGKDWYTDSDSQLYASDPSKAEVLFNRRSGVTSMVQPLQDGKMLHMKWRCEIGPDISK
ncbi:hypothetical protein CR62_24275 [Serratia grimesii]|uniref:Uncharacterized protein n=1 Tax=Serratia grimesii TaxID=82995 RepID=A0ABR4UBN2_9GAMM|nr:hypothetical protein CR62_24275 [Serratia grimesii]